jgi:phosphoenolpyruvate synthase/pyruvate phosphate dikinase
MKSAQGILTARGGMTSHAAVVARGMGACCVAGCSDIVFAEDEQSFTLGGKTYMREMSSPSMVQPVTSMTALWKFRKALSRMRISQPS